MMATMKMVLLLRVGRNTNFATITDSFYTSSAKYLNQYWRKQKGLSANPNLTGPLTTLPDFSYRDNRPSPYGSGQLMRIRKHQNYMRRVEKLVSEIDYAVERHNKLLKEKEEFKQRKLDSKLKPKGQLLLTDS